MDVRGQVHVTDTIRTTPVPIGQEAGGGGRNPSDESCRENQNARFMFSKFFLPKIPPSYKIWYSQTRQTWRYNAGQKRYDLHAG
jgi:hypothetical protein